jgi:hypothetical protein
MKGSSSWPERRGRVKVPDSGGIEPNAQYRTSTLGKRIQQFASEGPAAYVLADIVLSLRRRRRCGG